MTITKLYKKAEQNGVAVEYFPLAQNRSISALYDNMCYIAIDNELTAAEEKVCLAHELGHCETMSFYNIYSPLDIRGKHERRADCWAIGELIPKQEYFRALHKGYTQLNDLADYFDVTPEFMQKAVDYYNSKIA